MRYPDFTHTLARKTARAALSAAALTLLASCGKDNDGKSGKGGAPNPADRVQPVEVMQVATRALKETVGLVGTIAANESAELRPEIPGVVTAVEFQEGARLKKGDVLVRLDSRELNAQIGETRAQLELAASKLARNEKLLGEQAVSKAEYDATKADHSRLQAALLVLTVRQSKTVIRAPFAGIAGARSVSVGDYVGTNSVITTVDDLSRIKVEMDVPERYLPYLKKGSRFTLTAAALGKSVQGEVYFVSSNIDPDTRATPVKGYVSDPPPLLKPGMFANIQLVLREEKNALVVPETAVMNSPKGSVLVMPKEKDGALVAAFVPVRKGLREPGWVQVIPVGPPVKEGDRIVSSGVGGIILYPGLKLKPVAPVVTPGAPKQTDRTLEKK